MATLDDFISLLQGASNAAASNLSAPVDGINWVLKKAGLPVSEKPIGGSEWLRQIGFTAEPKNANMGLLGEAVGGVLPMVAAAKAPQIAAGINQMISNAQAPTQLSKQTGSVYIGGPQQKALETAQRNAAKPVSEGGLGLPPNNTPMDRAKALGFVDAYHGTKSDVPTFDLGKAGASDPGLVGKAVYATPTPAQASSFAESAMYGRGDAPNVMPLMVRLDNPAVSEDGVLLGKRLSDWHPQGITKQSAKVLNSKIAKSGANSVVFKSGGEDLQYAVLNPANIRSRFAAFDPARINENDLLGRADLGLLGLLAGGAAGAAYLMQDD